MTDWKVLKRDDLPPDILTDGRYEFEKISDRGMSRSSFGFYIEELRQHNYNKTWHYRYRKIPPKPPTHEEIMTKWWKDDKRGVVRWVKVVEYFPDDNEYSLIEIGAYVGSLWFVDRESADIPPEAE